MALTAVLLRANAALAGLSDEQIQAIEELSRNDENTVIGTRIGELHGQYDNDVLSVTGIAKMQGEKSYDYVKRVLGDFKQKASSADQLNQTITILKSEIEGYKKTIEEGKGNEEVTKQLRDAQKQLADTQALLETKNTEWENKYTQLNTQYQTSLIDAEFGKAMQGLKIKSIYPESVQKTLIDSAKRTVLATAKPDWVEENGERKLVFRDASGNIMTNPENKLNPFTPGELLKKELKDVLDNGRQQQGAGTRNPGGNGGSTFDLQGASTQVQADEMISKHLMSQGYTRGSKEFADEAKKLRTENGVDKLPIQ